MSATIRLLAAVSLGAALAAREPAPQETPETTRGPDRLDLESTRRIAELTTDPAYLSEWVDHLPDSDIVP